MSNRVEAYVNDILRGIQEALETEARGADLIQLAREAKQAQKMLERVRCWDSMWRRPFDFSQEPKA